MRTHARPLDRAMEATPPRASAAPLRLTLFHGFELAAEDSLVRLLPGAERLIALLALRGRSLARPHVAGILWPDTTDHRAGANLRSTLWRLRKAAYPLVEAMGSYVCLATEVSVDVHRMLDAAQRVLARSADWRDSDLAILLGSAELLPGWYEDWVLVERERLRQLRLRALEMLCDLLTTASRFGEAVEAGLAAVEDEPLRESANQALIRAHLAEGNVGEAVMQFLRFRQVLANELGLEPSPRTKELLPAGTVR